MSAGSTDENSAWTDEADPPLVDLVPAAPLTLHGNGLDRADCNSPVIRDRGRILAFVSDYHPIGHTYRREGVEDLASLGPRRRVALRDDPGPAVGKWIESVWRHPSGRLYGWYHAEEVAPCPRRLFMPHIGALVSDDDGLTWGHLGVLLRPGEAAMDCGFDNGFIAGGCGDFSVVADRAGAWFYLHFSNYVADESQQGICVARYPIAARDAPRDRLEVWSEGRWRPAQAAVPTPLWPMARGWRHPNPDGFWGPAVHFNRDLGLYVMLLNHTRNGRREWRSDGICVSFSARPADPALWTAPHRIVEGGVWYPQVVGLGPQDGDALAGAEARFFLSGFSAWHIRFGHRAGAAPQALPVITRPTIDALFAASSSP